MMYLLKTLEESKNSIITLVTYSSKSTSYIEEKATILQNAIYTKLKKTFGFCEMLTMRITVVTKKPHLPTLFSLPEIVLFGSSWQESHEEMYKEI